MVLTNENEIDFYPAATIEVASRINEERYYSNLSSSETAKPSGFDSDTSNHKVAALNFTDPARRIGPNAFIKVMATDTVDIQVEAFYKSVGQDNSDNSIPADMVAALIGSFGGSSSVLDAGGHYTIGQRNASTFTTGSYPNSIGNLKISDPNINSGKPKAYLNWILFDEQFEVVNSSSGTRQVNMAADTKALIAEGQKIMNKNGYLYVYLSNESPMDVYFDKWQVTHRRGPLLEEAHYYPFGMTMTGISSKSISKVGNRLKFNGKEQQNNEFSNGSGLEWLDYGVRMDDNQIGRFNGIDALADKYNEISTYCYVANNPTNAIDIDGKRIIYVNGYWNRFLNSLGLAPNCGGQGYWEYFSTTFLGDSRSFMNVQNSESSVFVDGSSRYAGDMSGGQRYEAGKRYAEQNYKDLVKGLEKGETFKFVSHSEGGAYAAGMADYLRSMEQTIETMLYMSPDEADEIRSPIGTFAIQAHYDNDIVSPSMRLGGVDVFVNFNNMDGKEVGKLDAHGASPTSKTIGKLKDALGLLHQVAGDSFMTKLFDVKGQWSVTETANGYRFTRNDSIKPAQEKKKQ